MRLTYCNNIAGIFQCLKLDVFVLLFFTFCIAGQAQKIEKESKELIKLLEENHYAPRTLNNTFSNQVFIQLMSYLDPRHEFFLQNEFDALYLLSNRIDEELKSDSAWTFLPVLSSTYKNCLLRKEKWADEIASKSLNFKEKEFLSLFPKDSLSFESSKEVLYLYTKKQLKYNALKQIIRQLQQDSKSDYSISPILESQVRKRILHAEKRKIHRVIDHPTGFENFIGTLFLNAIASCYDPHTVYLSTTDKQNFESQMSEEAYSFGFEAKENESGQIIIEQLIPGGPAWKSNELHKGDIIVRMQWEGKESQDMNETDWEDLESILKESNSSILKITIKEMNGGEKTIQLKKEKIRNDDNIVKSFLLKDKVKIGYISLPGFYAQWENQSHDGCANDVAKEILKLKEEGIQGLILDIRDNGGGSLMEGLDMAGIFINEGPLFLMKNREGVISIIKDMNRGTVFDGPLIVMVNGQSASASEILAATLQDYNRAVIVGTPTFGKSTGQIIIPMESINSVAYEKTEPPAVSVTIEKLYRITGKSAQLTGVTPDIRLPDMYEKFYMKENTYPFAFASDSIVKKVYYYPLLPLPIEKLKENSKTRQIENNQFKEIEKLVNTTMVSFDKTIELTINGMLKEMELIHRFKETEQDKQILHSNFKVENTDYEKSLNNMDTYNRELNDGIIKTIEGDLYINECFQIANDLIMYEKK